MYNAVRKPEEVTSKYGTHNFSALAPVNFTCTVSGDSEAMFRPALYKMAEYEPDDQTSELPEEKIPEVVVSMIGCYRNVARKGDRIKVAGTLEQVENVDTHTVFHQFVVGTGVNEEEYIWPL